MVLDGENWTPLTTDLVASANWKSECCYLTLTGSKKKWISGTGATDFMSGTVFNQPIAQRGTLNTMGRELSIVANNTARIKGAIMPVNLLGILHIPKLKGTNLISGRRLADDCMTTEGKRKDIKQSKVGTVLGKVSLNSTE